MIRFAVTIFISAFLLFQVQPLIARYILPWFGGTPAVWTTCMLFFQVLLLAGYSYSHFVTSLLKPRVQSILHITVLLLSLVFLPIIPDDYLKPTGEESPTMQILILLGITIGLPYILLSTTGPLIQAWFSRRFPGRSPYRLFALSNLGSLIALVSYPFAFEPFLRLSNQAWLWSGAYIVFVGSCCWCAFSSAFLQKETTDVEKLGDDAVAALPAAPPKPGKKPSVVDMLLWLGLSAVPSVLLLASTSQICQEVAVVPFLWILPLSLYLISFIICFDNPFWYVRSLFLFLTMATIIAAIYCLFSGVTAALYIQLLAFAGALFCCCMSCHGELAASKPDSKYLTLFYLMISIGGALGGVFVVVIAPRIFLNYWELHVGYIAALVLIMLAFVRNSCWDSLRLVLNLSAVVLVIAGALLLYLYPKFLDDYWYLKLAFLVSVVFSLAFALFGFAPVEWQGKPLKKSVTDKPHSATSWTKRGIYAAYVVVGLLITAWMAYALLYQTEKLAEHLPTRIGLLVASGVLFLLMASTIAFSDAWSIRGKNIVLDFTAVGLRSVYGIALIGAISTALMVHVFSGDENVIDQRRDFYGVIKVKEFKDRTKEGKFWKLEDDWSKLILINGRINHGEEFTREEKRMRPSTYYAPGSGVGIAVVHHPTRKQDHQKIKIGVIGLGTGTMAAWAEVHNGEKDEVRFYEINPEVEDIATNTFYFLKGSRGDVKVVLGDARIQLERERDQGDIQNFDVLAVDAFSSDAIPRHLITKECFDLYWEHLKPDGILAFHISNRYLDLDPVVYHLARRADYPAILINYYPTKDQQNANLADVSSWVLVTKNQTFLKDPDVVDAMSTWGEMKDIYWTDDFGSLWQIVHREKKD